MFHNDRDFVMDGKDLKPVKKALKNLSAAIGESKLFNHIYLYKPDIIKVEFKYFSRSHVMQFSIF